MTLFFKKSVNNDFKTKVVFNTLLPLRGGSYEYPQSMFLEQKNKKSSIIL